MNQPENAHSLSEAIENLSRKRHVLNEDAIKAGQDRQISEGASLPNKKISVVEEFNHSVHLLTSIFKESNFDELAMFVAHPGRVLIINFFIGILRGIGFMVGILLVIVGLAYLFQNNLPTTLLHLIPR